LTWARAIENCCIAIIFDHGIFAAYCQKIMHRLQTDISKCG
jgi:hypothetical protein